VSTAMDIFPAAELSQQISTAGTEASGTGNMKFALNGAMIIGTLDGANVEIREEVGDDNIFIFGRTAEEVRKIRSEGYRPREFYESNEELRQVLDMIGSGFFSPDHADLYKPIIDNLLQHDHYLLLSDYASYIACQGRVDALYRNQSEWTRRAILNVAGMGKFSSDRTIREYAEEIWNVKPVEVKIE
ncbi:MAG: glycogen/starch/alpha-glucan phosphorylase, partial [Gammaproteobacteria bacterium]